MKQYITIFLLFLGINLFAQEIKKTQDFGLWMGASLEYQLKKDYTLTLSQDVRLFENVNELDKYISDLGLDYKINKHFTLGANLRYFLKKEKDKTTSHNWRYNFDLEFKEKINSRFKFKYRFRLQTVNQDMFTVEFGGKASNFRNKIQFGYKLNKQNTIYSSAELFRKTVVYREAYFNKIRFIIGDKIKSKVGEFDVSFGYERELNSKNPYYYFFGRVYYTFKL